jgi:Family of unknown function (DUF6941)
VSTGSVSPKLSAGIIFSDSSIREQGTNKLTVIGSFQIFNAAAFPFASPPFHVTALIENLPVGEQVAVRVSLQNPEGAELAGATGQLKIDNLIEPRAHIELALPLPGLNFPTPGDYAVRVLVAEQEIGRKTLFLRSIPQMQIPTL